MNSLGSINRSGRFSAVLLLLAVFSLPGVTIAQQPADKTGFYIGGNYGGFKSRGGEFEDENDYLEAVAGIRFLPFLGIEGSYTNFGEFGGNAASAEVDGMGWAVVGYLPLTGQFDVYAKAGRFYSDVEVSFPGFRDEIEDEQPFYGLGLNYAISDPLALVIEYNRYKVGSDTDWPAPAGESDTDVDTIKFGIKLSF